MSPQPLRLQPADALELAECLEFLCDWFEQDRRRLDDSLWQLTEGGYRIGELCDDLVRFARLIEERSDAIFDWSTDR